MFGWTKIKVETQKGITCMILKLSCIDWFISFKFYYLFYEIKTVLKPKYFNPISVLAAILAETL